MSGAAPSKTRHTEPRGASRWAWVQLMIAGVFIALLALILVGFVLNATGAYHPRSSRAGDVIGAVVCLALLVLCLRWSVSVEHRLRGHYPVTRSFEARYHSPAVLGYRGLGRRKHYGPVALAVTSVVLAGGTIGLAVGAVVEHAHALRSSYVQHHGTLATAAVTSVVNTQHCSRSSCHYTSAIAVTLDRPIDGATSTIVHYPSFSTLQVGQPIIVLVDPKQPSYAEFPGAPLVTAGSWIILIVIAVGEGIISFLFFRSLLRVYGHRRDHLAQTGLPTAR